jgi:hypothetical protein
MLSEYGQAVGPDAAQIIHPSFARQILSRAAKGGEGGWTEPPACRTNSAWPWSADVVVAIPPAASICVGLSTAALGAYEGVVVSWRHCEIADAI